MNKPSILVLAASGSTGTQVCLQLLQQGYPVTAFVRREDARSANLKAHGATIFVGSMADITDLRSAVRGCQRAYFCAPISNGYLRMATAFATVAREEALETIVVMSQWLSSPTHRALQTRECWLADQVFSMLPNTDVITVNPGFFADNELQGINMTAIFGTFMIPYGNGLNAAPSNEDMARVISTLLMKPEGHAGKTYRITGPKLLSPTEITEILSKVLGRKVVYVQPPVWMVRRVLQGLGFDAYVAAQTLEYFEEYRRGSFSIGAPTDAVLQITGQPAEDYETTARRYAAQLPKDIRSLATLLKMIFKMNLWMLRPVPKTDPHLALMDFSSSDRATLSADSAAWVASHRHASPNSPHLALQPETATQPHSR